jgi:hypothetical protein
LVLRRVAIATSSSTNSLDFEPPLHVVHLLWWPSPLVPNSLKDASFSFSFLVLYFPLALGSTTTFVLDMSFS